jgi:zinc/manganese transport system substrate-binding protein
LLVFNGLELEVGWLPVLLQGARNPRLSPGGPGVFNASSAVQVLEVPKGELSRAQGDIHPYGNPHIMLNPRNGVRIAKALAVRLARLDPAGAIAYRANAASFADRLSKKIEEWEARLAPYRGRELVTYHRIWSYFFDWAGLRYAGVIEDKPGIPPAPAHVSEILKTMRSRNAKVIFLGNYLPRKIPQRLAERAGARVVVLPAQVGGGKGIKTYEDLIRTLVDRMTSALKN